MDREARYVSDRKISVVDPIATALQHMVTVLFKPFKARTWFGIGFMAFLTTNILAVVLQIFIQAAGNSWPWAARYFDEERTHAILDWYANNLTFFWVVTIGAWLLLAVIMLIIRWIRSRGIVMFFHGTATGRGSVPEAWRESKVAGNSLFRWQVVFMILLLGGFLLGCLILWIAIASVPPPDPATLAYPELRRLPEVPTWGIVVAVAVWVLVLIGLSVVEGVIQLILVPAMYVRRCTMIRAIALIRTELLPGRFWTFVGFFFFQWALLMLVGMAVQIIVLCTCCLGIVPYIGSVLQLPVLLAYGAYQLAFYQQFEDRWRSLPVVEVPVPPAGPVPPTTPWQPDE